MGDDLGPKTPGGLIIGGLEAEDTAKAEDRPGGNKPGGNPVGLTMGGNNDGGIMP